MKETKSPEQFGGRINAIRNESRRVKNVIVVIDLIQLSPPGLEKIRAFLADKLEHLEKHHLLKFSDEAMNHCIELLKTHIGEAVVPRLVTPVDQFGQFGELL